MYVFCESRERTKEGYQVLIPREVPLQCWSRSLSFRMETWQANYNLRWYRDTEGIIIVREPGE